MTYVPSTVLLEKLRAGNGWALGRLISRAEAGVPEARTALAEVYRLAGSAHVIGLTGVPGSGKSTLVAKLTAELRRRSEKVGIVAIDPSSPYSGGAILGDRIRMTELANDQGVFIRSMATRGATGGMARAALPIEQHDTRRATQAPLRHGHRQRSSLVCLVDADGELQSVLVDEGLQGR